MLLVFHELMRADKRKRLVHICAFQLTQNGFQNHFTWQLSKFLDDSSNETYEQSFFIRKYAAYLEERIVAYRTTKIDMVLDSMNTTKASIPNMLKCFKELQNQVDNFCKWNQREFGNALISYGFLLALNDMVPLIKNLTGPTGLVTCTNERIAELTPEEVTEYYEYYKKYLEHRNALVEIFETAKHYKDMQAEKDVRVLFYSIFPTEEPPFKHLDKSEMIQNYLPKRRASLGNLSSSETNLKAAVEGLKLDDQKVTRRASKGSLHEVDTVPLKGGDVPKPKPKTEEANLVSFDDDDLITPGMNAPLAYGVRASDVTRSNMNLALIVPIDESHYGSQMLNPFGQPQQQAVGQQAYGAAHQPTLAPPAQGLRNPFSGSLGNMQATPMAPQPFQPQMAPLHQNNPFGSQGNMQAAGVYGSHGNLQAAGMYGSQGNMQAVGAFGSQGNVMYAQNAVMSPQYAAQQGAMGAPHPRSATMPASAAQQYRRVSFDQVAQAQQNPWH
eukprot:Colp12_sorted_trinity150504_noHs@24123